MGHFGQKSRKHANKQFEDKKGVHVYMVQMNRSDKASVDFKSFQCFKAQIVLIISEPNLVTFLQQHRRSFLSTSLLASWLKEGDLCKV